MTQPVTPAVSTKMRPVRVPVSAIDRPVLLETAEAIFEHRVTVVTAPAGFGKSWLIADWLSYHPEAPISWLSLDRYDSDPVRLLTHLVESVAMVYPSVGAAVLDVMSSPLNGLPLSVDAMAEALGEESEDYVLVIDDVHILEEGDASALLEQVVAELPEQVHVVLIGRRDPSFPLSRHRVAGDLLEVRTGDLRCSDEEVRELVSRVLDTPVTSEAAEDLNRRSMGWIAGIRLAAGAALLNLDGSALEDVPSVGSLDGAYDAVGDYLIEEALDHLDQAERQFLLDTSVLELLPLELCDLLTGSQDSGRFLHRLARSGMFTTVRDESASEYAYHDVFKGAMRSILWREQPERAAELCSNAARWYQRRGDTLEAVPLAIDGGIAEEAGQWITDAIPSLLAMGQASTLYDVIGNLHAATASLPVLLDAAWCLPAVYLDKPESEVDYILDHAIEGLLEARESMRESDESWQGTTGPLGMTSDQYLRELIAMSSYRRGDLVRGTGVVEEMAGEVSKNGFIEAVSGGLLISDEQYEIGLDQLQRWYDFIFTPESWSPGNKAEGLMRRATADLGRGHLGEAESLSNSSREELLETGFGSITQLGIVTVPAARVAWERGDLDRVFDLLDPVMDRIDMNASVPTYVEAHLVRARALWSEGDRDGAHREAEAARVTPSGRTVQGLYRDRVLEEAARFSLLEGDVESAARVIAGFADVGGPSIRHFLLEAWLVSSQGDDPTQLLDSLPDNREKTIVHDLDGHLVVARRMLAAGDSDRALSSLVEAMKLGASTGHVQRFMDERPFFGSLFDNAVAMSGHRLPLSTDEVSSPRPAQDFRLSEPLTQSELALVRLLPSHMTYQELADQLMISPNTVKSHLKGVYRKLGASKRSEAVNAARSLNLID